MIKNRLDFKLINTAIFVLIIGLMYQSGGLWSLVIDKIFKVLFPFLLAFALAYALYPFTLKLRKYNIPKGFSILIVLFVFFGIFILIGTLALPLLFEQLGNLFNGIIAFIRDISLKYDLDFGPLQETLSNSFDDIIKNFGKYISDGAISIISTSLSYIGTFIVILASSIYLLFDMDRIRKAIKRHYKKKGRKTYNYVIALDNAMKGYMDGFTKIVLITVLEYTFAFTVIGHPDAVLLGCIAALGNLIPYFGGIATNLIALITAFVVGPSLFVKALIVFAILSLVDSYIINPFVYGKSTEASPIIVIFSVFAGGILFGLIGIIISLPVAIIMITTYNYYKSDITEKIEELKEENN